MHLDLLEYVHMYKLFIMLITTFPAISIVILAVAIHSYLQEFGCIISIPKCSIILLLIMCTTACSSFCWSQQLTLPREVSIVSSLPWDPSSSEAPRQKIKHFPETIPAIPWGVRVERFTVFFLPLPQACKISLIMYLHCRASLLFVFFYQF